MVRDQQRSAENGAGLIFCTALLLRQRGCGSIVPPSTGSQSRGGWMAISSGERRKAPLLSREGCAIIHKELISIRHKNDITVQSSSIY